MRTKPPFRLEWKKLLSDQRYGKKRNTQDNRTPFERDYGRIIFSAPFRRLAKKTQVHPFAEIDEIHTRLTHSLEVASVGRSLGVAVCAIISEREGLPSGRTCEDLICIVESACLAHDIGNPPFGHAGEAAIREWAAENEPAFRAKGLSGIKQDWRCFDGNAQAFRMLSRRDATEQSFFNLTYATLGTMVKYPWTPADVCAKGKGKANVFSTEREIFYEMVRVLGLKRPGGAIARHPLSFLSEAADDICYRIADLEDAVRMKILPKEEVQSIFADIIGDAAAPYRLPVMRARAIGRLIKAASDVFETHYDSIMRGTYAHPLKDGFPKPMKDGLARIREKYENDIFRHRRKVATEIGAFSIIARILDTYTDVAKALSACKDYDKLGYRSQRCCTLAWGEDYVREHSAEGYAWWLSRVLDFAAGMTDDYATQVASEIQG
ncbi:MAG: dNTP triphosphohydrolase [Kiritimatiellaeota bacterium]|nr:dNTP triphosphohydrolase [Kiritimatiellota bacterium]